MLSKHCIECDSSVSLLFQFILFQFIILEFSNSVILFLSKNFNIVETSLIHYFFLSNILILEDAKSLDVNFSQTRED